MRTALAFICYAGAILLSASLLIMGVLALMFAGTAVIHVNPFALAAWVALDAMCIYGAIRLPKRTGTSDATPH